jgi:hypothetical protein
MSATQRIVRVRRQYNQWVADQSLEDYALRFTGYVARRWSHFRVANTAIGSISFLALEAIGGLITLQYGFTNAVCAIAVVSTLIFLSSLAIAYYAATYGLDIDLLTRGAGFGYLGSSLSSLIYAIFTFVFFAIEAAIMAVALEMGLGIPLQVGYALSSLIIIPLVAYGITLISRLQLWTQPLWIVLQLAPFLALAIMAPDNFRHWVDFSGVDGMKPGFDFVLFGAATSVIFSLMGQIGEQADFLRFMPPRDHTRIDWRWWGAMLIGGPGWIVIGALKMLAGSLLAVVAMRHGLTPQYAAEPVEMYRVGFKVIDAEICEYAIDEAATKAERETIRRQRLGWLAIYLLTGGFDGRRPEKPIFMKPVGEIAVVDHKRITGPEDLLAHLVDAADEGILQDLESNGIERGFFGHRVILSRE